MRWKTTIKYYQVVKHKSLTLSSKKNVQKYELAASRNLGEINLYNTHYFFLWKANK